jgi:hypothetical protein
MKIEMDDNSSVAATVIAIAIIIALSCLGGCKICEQTKRDAINAGLVEKPQPSTCGTMWAKP